MAAVFYPGIGRYLIGTFVLSTVIAAALTVFGSHRHGFGINFVYSQCIGMLTYATIDLPRRMLWPQGMPSLAPLLGLVLLAAPVGWFGGTFVASMLLGRPWAPGAMSLDAVLGFLALTAGAGLIGCFYFMTRERLMASERSAVEARLKLLQAQIEPHFLFNMLGNVRRLYRTDRHAGADSIASLMRYLRIALPQLRSRSGTLADEIELVRSYLELYRIRMGTRLAFSIEVEPSLRGVAFPPMLLVTLAENAIRHGVEPAGGGEVLVRARREGNALQVAVLDDGAGFGAAASSGTGVGLANVRRQLAARYPGGAGLTLQSRRPRGASASIWIPLPAAA